MKRKLPQAGCPHLLEEGVRPTCSLGDFQFWEKRGPGFGEDSVVLQAGGAAAPGRRLQNLCMRAGLGWASAWSPKLGQGLSRDAGCEMRDAGRLQHPLGGAVKTLRIFSGIAVKAGIAMGSTLSLFPPLLDFQVRAAAFSGLPRLCLWLPCSCKPGGRPSF